MSLKAGKGLKQRSRKECRAQTKAGGICPSLTVALPVPRLTHCDLIRQFGDTTRDIGTERMTLPRRYYRYESSHTWKNEP
jgi:hypothetical protein